ncbi:MAG: patatin-like phospholipase family protein, partial [Gemmataceae bacterium]
MDLTAYLGLYDAAVEAGKAPDLIIATSGGAVAAGIIAAFPDKNERLAFLESEVFYHFMSDLPVTNNRPINFFTRLPRFIPRTYGLAPLTPNLWRKPLS